MIVGTANRHCTIVSDMGTLKKKTLGIIAKKKKRKEKKRKDKKRKTEKGEIERNATSAFVSDM